MTTPVPVTPSATAAPAPPPVPSPRAIDAMAAVLAHVAGLPRADARARVEAVVHEGRRVLEVCDGFD
jgi:predicted methyltransferase